VLNAPQIAGAEPEGQGTAAVAPGYFTNVSGLSDNTVLALYEDADRNLWIGTAYGGLNRYRDGRVTAYTSRQGLWSDEIFEILEDDQGWLWMSCSKGVFRVRKTDLAALDQRKVGTISSLAYGRPDGLETTQCSDAAKPAGWKTRDGRLWFATSKGLVAVNPSTARVNTVPPPVFIEEIVADRKTFSIGPAQASPASDPDAGHTARITIPPGRGELEFHYTALNLQAPEASRFKYKLEPVDAEWLDAGTRRTAHYVNVYPGRYSFRVIACNKDGVWNERGAALEVFLRPHIWQIWWLRAGAGLLVVGLASGSARYVTRRRMQRKLELVEQRHAIERERGRIAKDIHDDLGSSLTRIMMLGERAEEGLANREEVGVHVGKIVSSARRTVQALDEIVWAVNPENDTLDGLVEYISHYADEFFEDTGVSCRLEIPVQLPALPISAEVRHDLFLVVKEAFNNILKHAGATEVRVQVACADNRVEIVVADNGRGFDAATVSSSRGGNGLRNMRKRLTGLDGQFDVTSGPGQGTRLTLSARMATHA
jgi:signal transduction histidine kinase